MKIAATLRVVLFTLTTLVCSAASAQAATVTEFSDGITLPASPVEIAAGPDGNLWFTEVDGDAIGRITPSGRRHGVRRRHRAAAASRSGSRPVPTATCGSPSTTRAASAASRPAGVVTEFSAGITPGSSPRSIVTGPDG